MVDHYTTLGVARDADADTIKKAYRSKAQKTHPDKGGDTAAFADVQKAYDTLSDPDRRKRYDETGSDDQQDYEARVYQAFAQLLLSSIDKEPEHVNLVSSMRNHLLGMTMHTQAELSAVKTSIKKREKALKKFKFTADGTGRFKDVATGIITTAITDAKAQKKQLEEKIKFVEDVRSLVEQYSHTPDVEPRYQSTIISNWAG